MKTDWLFQEPIDLEHKQYVLLDYLQKLDKNLNNLMKEYKLSIIHK
jgi:hypothetical protein